MTEREAIDLIRREAYKRTLPSPLAHPRWDEAWLDPGPSPAGNAGPYAKVPIVNGCIVRVYPKKRAWLRILRELDYSTCRHMRERPRYLDG